MLSGIFRDTFFGERSDAEEITVRAHRDVAREGEMPTTSSMLLEGWAGRYRRLPDGRRQLLALVLPGDLCHPYVSLTGTLDHSIGALTDARLVSNSRARFDALVAERPALAQAIWRQDLIREAMLRELVLALGRKSAKERLAHILAETFLRLQVRGATSGDSCDFHVTQGDLADLVGLTPVHVNRTLRALRQQGLASLQGRRLTIPSMPALFAAGLLNPRYLRYPAVPEWEALRIDRMASSAR